MPRPVTRDLLKGLQRREEGPGEEVRGEEECPWQMSWPSRGAGAGHPWKAVVEGVSQQPHLCPVLSISVPVAKPRRLELLPTHVCSMGPLAQP